MSFIELNINTQKDKQCKYNEKCKPVVFVVELVAAEVQAGERP